ncbi:MAG: SprT family zinc-dependent metalloprotease [Agathobacter sp.]|nr:SprT family zinc-dependent metalloprotease [Agathobacter sp.]
MGKREENIVVDDLEVHIIYKNNKNMYLRVKGTDNKIEITAPFNITKNKIIEFVKNKEEWIYEAISRQKNLEKQRENEIVIPPFVEREMRYELKKTIQSLLDKWEPVMNVYSCGFTIKKMKTRWGSCNVNSHHLNFNLALAKVPLECVEYVVVHELTHLLEPSHNARFWSLMEYYLKGSKMLRKKLNEYQ